MNKSSLFLNAQEVASIMSISVSKAYKIIRGLNEELSDAGYLTVQGKVNRVYFEHKIYGGFDAAGGAQYAGL